MDGGGLIGGFIERSAEAVLGVVVQWIVSGASWLLGELMGFVTSSTRPDLRQDWFAVAYSDMARVALVLLLPMLLLAVIQAILRQQPGQLGRIVLIGLPIAGVGTFAAVSIVDQLVALTDLLSAWVGRSLGADLQGFATSMGGALDELVFASWGNPVALPGFAVFLAAGVTAFASMVIWVVLVLRQAAIYAAVLFLPLGFAALVWPATVHWLKRLVEGLLAVVMAKFVIVAVLAMAARSLSTGAQEGLATVITGGSLLLLAAFAPFVLLRFIPVFEAGVAGHWDGVGSRRAWPLMVAGAAGAYRSLQARGNEAGGHSGDASPEPSAWTGAAQPPAAPNPAPASPWAAQAGPAAAGPPPAADEPLRPSVRPWRPGGGETAGPGSDR